MEDVEEGGGYGGYGVYGTAGAGVKVTGIAGYIEDRGARGSAVARAHGRNSV